jgi:hypothetical protein
MSAMGHSLIRRVLSISGLPPIPDITARCKLKLLGLRASAARQVDGSWVGIPVLSNRGRHPKIQGVRDLSSRSQVRNLQGRILFSLLDLEDFFARITQGDRILGSFSSVLFTQLTAALLVVSSCSRWRT